MRPYPKDIIDTAIDKLLSLLTNMDRDTKRVVINRCYERLVEEKASSMQCIRIMMKILESIPKEKISNFVSSAEIAHSLVD